MFRIARYSDLKQDGALLRSMLSDRTQQFVSRHNWTLELDDFGLEVDEYDNESTDYCIVAEGTTHRASLRLREARADSMVEKYFPALWAAHLSAAVEITRFCAAPDLPPHQRTTAVSDLLLGMCRHCQRTNVGSLFGVVFPAVARVIKQAGWPGEILSQQRTAEGLLLLARWVPSDLVAWSIQERSEAREALRAPRHEIIHERFAA